MPAAEQARRHVGLVAPPPRCRLANGCAQQLDALA